MFSDFLLPGQPVVHFLPPAFAPDGGRPESQGAGQQKGGADGAEPADADAFDGGQADGGTGGGEDVADHVVPRHHLGRATFGLHHVETVGVEGGKAEELRHPLYEHGRHRQWDTAHRLVDAPAVHQHASGNHDADERQTRSQPVFGHAPTLPPDPPLHHPIRPPAAEEGAQQISAAGRDVEEARLDRRGQVEARVEHVADRGQERVHVPHQATGGQAGDDEVRVFEQEDQDAQRGDQVSDSTGLGAPGEMGESVDRLGGNGFRQEDDHQDRGQATEGRLKPEDDPPGPVGDDDASDERSEGRSDETAREKPGQRGGAPGRGVDVPQTGGADDEERGSLEGGEHAEDEIRRQVWSQSGADAEGEEQQRRTDADPLPAVHLRQWTPNARTQAHEDEVKGIGQVDDAARGVVTGGHFRDGTEDGGG